MDDTVSRLLNAAEVARHIHTKTSVKVVHGAVRRGELAAVRMGRKMMFERQEVERFIARLPAWSASSSSTRAA